MEKKKEVHPLRHERLRRGWTQKQLADFAQISLNSVVRAEQGNALRVDICQRLCEALDKTLPEELGLRCKGNDIDEDSGDERIIRLRRAMQSQTQHELTIQHRQGDDDERLSSTMPAMQARLEQEGEDEMNRREMLQLMTGVGTAAVTSSPDVLHLLDSEQSISSQALNRESINHLENIITSCWGLSGTQLHLTEQMLHPLLGRLSTLTHQSSVYRKTLARLTSLGYLLADILALHRLDFKSREFYCKQAAYYAQIAGDRDIEVMALVHMAGTYYYTKRPKKMLQVYQEVLQCCNQVSPQLQIRIKVASADAYALNGQKRESLYCLESVLTNFFTEPKSDTFLLDSECGPSVLCLWSGLAYSDLEQPEKALDIFAQAESMSVQSSIPERIRIELINQKAKAAVASGDLEQSMSYIEQGVLGALSINSEKRFSETLEIYQQMCLVWRFEPRVKQLSPLFAR